MSDDDEDVRVPAAELRRILHRYNNLTARILTRAEVALMEDDPAEHIGALERITASAEDLARFTRETRALLLGDD
jgi:hypothetical protein